MSKPVDFAAIFEVMAAASVGDTRARVQLADAPDVQDTATRFALAVNLLLDDLAVQHDEVRQQRQEIALQRQRLRELSMPILPIGERILLLPIIGEIDVARAELIGETLLKATQAHRAHVVILDLSGVPRLDMAAATGLIQATNGVRLLGAEIAVAGIGTQVAASMIEMGVSLHSIPTLDSVASALEWAQSAGQIQTRSFKRAQPKHQKTR